MKLIAFSFMLLVILEESYCKTTSSVNRTSTSWGYDYSLSDTRGFKVKHDDKEYQFEPIYNDTSSGLKKHYSSKSVYDQFTSPGATDHSQSHSSTNDVINDTSNGTTGSRSNITLESSNVKKKINTVLSNTSGGGKITTTPVTKTHTVTFINTQTEAAISTDQTSYEAPSSSHIPVGGINGTPSVSSNGKFYKTTFEAPNAPQNTPIYAAPTGPLYYPQAPSYKYYPQAPSYKYYPQAPSYGQMYGPAGGATYGISNGQIYGLPMGPMYGPQTGGTYGISNGQIYGLPMGPVYGPQTGGTYRPDDPVYGVPTRSMYAYVPQNGQMYGPPNGQMYVPQNGQTNGYPIGSLYGSTRIY